MKTVLAFVLAFICVKTAWASDLPDHKITENQAEALVMASLTAQQRQLPKVEVDKDESSGSSRFLFFTVTWEGTLNGSVVVGDYAVDPYTGDVFSATRECYEEKNKVLEALQAQIRATLHLSQLRYQQIKTSGPLCQE